MRNLLYHSFGFGYKHRLSTRLDLRSCPYQHSFRLIANSLILESIVAIKKHYQQGYYPFNIHSSELISVFSMRTNNVKSTLSYQPVSRWKMALFCWICARNLHCKSHFCWKTLQILCHCSDTLTWGKLSVNLIHRWGFGIFKRTPRLYRTYPSKLIVLFARIFGIQGSTEKVFTVLHVHWVFGYWSHFNAIG